MSNLLQIVGQIAGLGGLSLGVFLLLFRRIELPRASRRHLTLFMWLVWTMAGIGVVAFVIGNLIESKSQQTDVSIPTFRGTVCLTWYCNEEFATFLEVNRDHLVFLDLTLDQSLGIEEHWRIQQKFNPDVDLFSSNDGNDIKCNLPLDFQSSVSIVFHLLNDHKVFYSAGGTGVSQGQLRGFFDVVKTHHGGPSVLYHLIELPSTIDLRTALVND